MVYNFDHYILQIEQIKNDLKLQETNENISNLLMEVAEEIQQSENTLQQGEIQQKTRENLLAQANSSYEKADKAVKLGAKILEEAQQTLSTLRGKIANINFIIIVMRVNDLYYYILCIAFDKQVQDSKKNATEALGQVPQIKQLIEEANDKTVRAQQALEGAESSAKNAKATAEEAQIIYAEQAVNVRIIKFNIISQNLNYNKKKP